ncbi:MAG: class B sortase [Peptostreptococcaceae bacterium]|nr:class B sortase [Peptostreptococcaceae bacterium]
MNKRKILKIIIYILILVVAFSIYKIGTALYSYHEAEKTYADIQEDIGVSNEFSGSIDFDMLLKVNKDVVAWIYSEGTVINYPIVRSSDNNEYLYKLITGKSNSNGTIFVDYRCDEPFIGFNTVIHGHHMNDGSMFCSLENYSDIDYYNEHKIIDIVTPNCWYEMVVFASFVPKAGSEVYTMNIESTEAKDKLLEYIKANNDIETGVDVTAEDTIVTLSTCAYEFKDARTVVIGKLIEK